MSEIFSMTSNVSEIKRVFELQNLNQYQIANTQVKERIVKLKALKKAIEITYRGDIENALKADFGKPKAEVNLTEIFAITSEINHAIKHLSVWMQKHEVDTPIAFIGSSSYYQYEPKGVCLIISPWNFPFNLTFCPLVSAIAAGNTVVLKPSEMTPNSANLIVEIVQSLFEEKEVAIFTGGVEVASELLKLPFNHIFYTGSPSVGKIVMKAAAEHLTSVTLELGGKSPTIIDETANVKIAALRIASGKFTNSGQICIAPDYILVHRSVREAFVHELSKVLDVFYSKDAKESSSYTQMVNQKHAERVLGYIDQAVSKGAKIIYGGQADIDQKYIAPTLIEEVDDTTDLMQNEIFGPVLPIKVYDQLDEALCYIQKNEKPLALYIYSRNESNINRILSNTRAGGVGINNNGIHFFNNNLPFGGSNNSGIGKSHGFFGFQSFSDAKSVYRQHMSSAAEWLSPPYNSLKERLINWTVKFL